MGWTGHDLGNGWSLMTRGGLHGVYINNNKEGEEKIEIGIPEELLVSLAADHVRFRKITHLENAEDNEILGIEP